MLRGNKKDKFASSSDEDDQPKKPSIPANKPLETAPQASPQTRKNKLLEEASAVKIQEQKAEAIKPKASARKTIAADNSDQEIKSKPSIKPGVPSKKKNILADSDDEPVLPKKLAPKKAIQSSDEEPVSKKAAPKPAAGGKKKLFEESD